MRQRKFRFLLVALVVALGLLFAGGEARAAVLSYNIDGVSVVASGPATATYTYTFSQNAGSNALGYIDFEIPVEIVIPTGAFTAAGTSSFEVSIGSTGLSGEVYGTGIGDFGTKFGVGDIRYKVLKVTVPSGSSPFSVVLTIKNQVPPAHYKLGGSQGQILIKAGNGSVTQSFTIDTPAFVRESMGTLTFSASPSSIRVGDCPTLAWEAESAAYVFISNVNINGGLMTSPDGGFIVLAGNDCPVYDTDYVLTAIGTDGSKDTITATVLVGSPPLVPVTPNQSLSIPDVDDTGGITFNIIRNPRSGQIIDVQVCGDMDYCEGDCCSLETRGDLFGESIQNCTNLNGNQGLQECIIAGTGSPHTQNIVSGTITKVYAYCRTGEVKQPAANSFKFDCYKNGVPHTD